MFILLTLNTQIHIGLQYNILYMNKLKMEEKQIQRGSIDIGEEEIRLYDIENSLLPSVSTITDFYSDSLKEHILTQWKDKYDGDGIVHHKDIKHLKGLRGTIAHAKTLSEFTVDEIWGEEEQEAQNNLENFESYREEYIENTDEHPWNPEHVPFFDDGESAIDWCDRTVPQIKQEFLDETLTDIDEVIAVEEYLYSFKHNYAGQVDLVYRKDNGDIVLCDLKTSKSIYHTHKLQVAGYAEAFEEKHGIEVDMLKIARSSPESRGSTHEFEVELQWDETREAYFDEFITLLQYVEYLLIEEGWDSVKEMFEARK